MSSLNLYGQAVECAQEAFGAKRARWQLDQAMGVLTLFADAVLIRPCIAELAHTEAASH